jgi:hypothetical protein
MISNTIHKSKLIKRKIVRKIKAYSGWKSKKSYLKFLQLKSKLSIGEKVFYRYLFGSKTIVGIMGMC